MAITQTITPLPAAPNPSMSEEDFDATATEFTAALPPLVTEINALADQMEAEATSAANSATSATTSKNAAATSATNAASSATAAAASATNAANSATSATTSKNAAATSATNAASSATAAAASATNAANSAAYARERIDDLITKSGQTLNTSDTTQLALAIQRGIPQPSETDVAWLYRRKDSATITEYGCTMLGGTKGFRVETAGCKVNASGNLIYTSAGNKASYAVLHDGDISLWVSAHPTDATYPHTRIIGTTIPAFFMGLQVGSTSDAKIRGALSTPRNLKINTTRAIGVTETWTANNVYGTGEIVTTGTGTGDMFDLATLSASPSSIKTVKIKQTGRYLICPSVLCRAAAGSGQVTLAVYNASQNFVQWIWFSPVTTAWTMYGGTKIIHLIDGQHIAWTTNVASIEVLNNQAHTELGLYYLGQS